MEDQTAARREAAGRRAAAYWFIDGLPEVVFGIVFVVWGSIGMAWGFHSKDRWMLGAYVVVGLAFALLWWKDRVILDYLKARLTYPRTGYVRPPVDPKPIPYPWCTARFATPIDSNVTSFRMSTAFIFVVASQLASLNLGHVIGRWIIVPIVMAVVAMAVYARNRREAHPYSWQSALAIALAGLVSASLEVPPNGRRYIPLLIGGVWLLAHGVPTLVRYLRTYPAPKGEGA